MKANLLRAIAVIALTLVISQTAHALQYRYDYDGPVTMKFVNWDMGTVYELGLVPFIVGG